MGSSLEDQVDLARQGDQVALEAVLGAIQGQVYGLARRMLWHPADAEDASQEILLKVLTHLSTFRRESSFLTWVYRIACHHLLTRRKQRAEAKMQTFEQFEAMLEDGRAAGQLAEDESGDDWLLVEEIKIGCTMGMLLCLDREDRIAYILGEIFEVSGQEAASILAIPAPTFRKRLSRARQRLSAFMQVSCGLINPEAPCRCSRYAAFKKASRGREFTEQLVFAAPLLAQRKDPQIVAGMQDLQRLDRIAALFRSHPTYQAPQAFVEAIQQLLRSGTVQLFTLGNSHPVEQRRQSDE
jgi:RNA polymerase sigma factor (sigma-70 family)